MPIDSAVTQQTTQNIGIASNNMTEQMKAAMAAQEGNLNRQAVAQEGAANRAAQSADYAQLNKSRKEIADMELTARERQAQLDRQATEAAAKRSEKITLTLAELNAKRDLATAEEQEKIDAQMSELYKQQTQLRARMAAAKISTDAVTRKGQVGALEAASELNEYKKGVKQAINTGVDAGRLGATSFAGKVTSVPEGQMVNNDFDSPTGRGEKSKGGVVEKKTAILGTRVFGVPVTLGWWSSGGVEQLQEDLDKAGYDASSLLESRPDVYDALARELGTELAKNVATTENEGAAADGFKKLLTAMTGHRAGASKEQKDTTKAGVRSALDQLKAAGVDPTMAMHAVAEAIGTLQDTRYDDETPLRDADRKYSTQEDKTARDAVAAAMAPWVRTLGKQMRLHDDLVGSYLPSVDEIEHTVQVLTERFQTGDLDPETLQKIVTNPKLLELLADNIEALEQRKSEMKGVIRDVDLLDQEDADLKEAIIDSERRGGTRVSKGAAQDELAALQALMEEGGG